MKTRSDDMFYHSELDHWVLSRLGELTDIFDDLAWGEIEEYVHLFKSDTL